MPTRSPTGSCCRMLAAIEFFKTKFQRRLTCTQVMSQRKPECYVSRSGVHPTWRDGAAAAHGPRLRARTPRPHDASSPRRANRQATMPADAPAPVPLPAIDPLGPARRLAAAAVADAVGAVDRGRRLSGLAPAGGVHARHDPDAQRGLLHQRRRRPRIRPPRQAHRAAPGDERRRQPARGAGASARCSRCWPSRWCSRPTRRPCCGRSRRSRSRWSTPTPSASCSMPQEVLGVAFSFGIPMAFAAVNGGRSWDLVACAAAGAGARLVAAARQCLLGAGLRHRVRDGRPRRRPARSASAPRRSRSAATTWPA